MSGIAMHVMKNKMPVFRYFLN
uniref:Uncharacterized protein n=1 Tax=Anguilla anguilla TaxID=7936 RepID=A0A0E9RSW7_ANGAN